MFTRQQFFVRTVTERIDRKLGVVIIRVLSHNK